MNMWPGKVLICAGLLSVLPACNAQSITDSRQARIAADSALKKYCDSFPKECFGLRFVKTSDFDEKWLVEYESKQFLYAVIVTKDGSSEITKTSEK